MAHSPPSPPSRLGQDSITLSSALAGASIIMVFGIVGPGEARVVVDVLFGGSVVMLMLQGICDCSLHVFHIAVLVVGKLEVLQDMLICFCLQQINSWFAGILS